nr:transposase, MuDR, MULE transposase domain protein [Tanacetum cinerariifolium]
MNRGSILHEDLTYAMLHEMVMKKFILEAIYTLNLSAKVSSIDDNFDITDDHETTTNMKMKNEFDDVVDEKPLPNFQKWQKYMSFKPDIPETPLYKSKTMISKDYKKETNVKVGKIFDNKEALDLAIRLKALDVGYLFLNDRSAPERRAAIALAVQDEFPLSYHVVCCRHLMMNLSLKRDQTKALFWRICKAYTTEEFSTSMSHLHDIQTVAYDKLCQVGPQRWSRAHCPLVRYNYLTSNSVESVNACTVVYRKMPVLKLAETYPALMQEWYYQRRKLTENMTYEITDWAANKVKVSRDLSSTDARVVLSTSQTHR